MDNPSAIYIIFDGPPDHEAPRFVEIENPEGRSIRIGEWEPDPRPEYEGQWRIRITFADMVAESNRQWEARGVPTQPETSEEQP